MRINRQISQHLKLKFERKEKTDMNHTHMET